jgi:serine/threonine protein kinase
MPAAAPAVVAAPRSPPYARFVPPRSIGPYEILSVIGRGGIGTVYRARHRETGEVAALKLLGPPPACDPIAARRLAREFEALRCLDHPNVVRVHAAGVHEGYSYLAMELVQGLDLRSYLSPCLDELPELPGRLEARPSPLVHGIDVWSDEPETGSLLTPAEEGPPSGPDAIRAFAALMEEAETDPRARPAQGSGERSSDTPDVIDAPLPAPLLERLNAPARLRRLEDAVCQVCDGLAYVHRRGLVHRDLKPSNIMVDDGRRVRLMDFGLVKLASDSLHLTQHGRAVGTYRYMAPEQARGEPVDHRADLYSLGVILFELVCGRPPFLARRPTQLWGDIVSRIPPPVESLNPAANPRLARLAERLLAKEPLRRIGSAEEVAAALRG